jgi:hypothetical protein
LRIPRETKFIIDPRADSARFVVRRSEAAWGSFHHLNGEMFMNDTENFTALYANHHKALEGANAMNKAAVFDALSAAGITTVTVSFDGESDSGQIEEMVAYVNGIPQELPVAQVHVQRPAWPDGNLDSAHIPVTDAIEALGYDYLSQEHGGWENNDGAFGEFTFHVAERRIDLVFHARYSDFVSSNHTF